MVTTSDRIVYSDEKRHKCLKCGSVRYESFMRKPSCFETTACPQFGNDLKQWICKKH